ncbi:MAG: hypothetical protein R3F19_23670 [Verrucomicrobiales bacterium]
MNSALLQVAEIEERLLAEQQSKPPLDDEQRERLMSLGADLHSLWNEDAAPTDLKKRLREQ